MEKLFLASKSVQGVILAVIGFVWGIWAGETEISRTMIIAGLGWAGYGFRDAME